MKNNKLLLPYDIFERHKKVGSFVEDGDTVLDVGGELNQLSQFCSPSKIVVANLEKSQEDSDVIIKKGKLPFKASEFDTVCSIDVLEHIKKSERENFIFNLLDIASKKVILSFPIGTQNHIEYEKKMQKYLEAKNHDVTYLKEHIALGLPQKEEIEKMLKGKKFQIYYSGSLNFAKFLFKLHIFDPHVRGIRKIVYLAKLAFNLLTNYLFFLIFSDKKYSTKVVRAYIVILKRKPPTFMSG